MKHRLFLIAYLALTHCIACDTTPHSSLVQACSSCPNPNPMTPTITTQTQWSELIAHPALQGFAQFVLPQQRGYDPSMPLGNMARLMPWHSYVNPQNGVAVINSMIATAEGGEQIFYNIYTDSEKKANKRLEDTGLFFFRGKKEAPFAIVCPGGGFSYVGAIHESFPLCMELARMGYNAFSIQYRTGGAQPACEDLARAIDFVLTHAEELGVSTEGYSLWGGSAGARMAAYLGSYGTEGFGAPAHPRPVTVIMGYTGHSDYTPNDPPTYAIIGTNDAIASPRTMKTRTENLQRLGIDAEFHLKEGIQHGFGLALGTSIEGWQKDAVRFWEKHIKNNPLKNKK